MTKEDELKLKFYKNGAAEAVLKRFMFTEKEKKLIQDAIRTSNMPNPRMKLIDEVDVLLKDVAKSREPIVIDSETKIAAEDMIKFANMKIKATQRKNYSDNEDERLSFFGISLKSKYGKRVFLFIIIILFMMQYFTIKSQEIHNAKIKALIYDEYEGTPVKR